jgi:two-component system, NtrC family, sensor histidine kinase PilS
MRIIAETGQNFSTFLAARLIFVTALLGVAVIFRPSGDSLAEYLILFVSNAMLSVGCWEWFRRRRTDRSLRWFALSAAVLLDTLALHITGGSDSEFVFLYFFSIGSAGFLLGLLGSIWTAALSTMGMLWLYYDQSGGWMAEHALHAFVFAINFILTALLTSYVFDKISERERRHQQTLGELEQTRLDTQAILDSLGTGVVVVNPEQHVLYSNPAGRGILGLSRDSKASDLEAMFAQGSQMGDALQSLLENPPPESRCEIALQNGGMSKPIGYSASALRDPAGELRGHIILFSDLSRVKEIERNEREHERLAAIGRLSRDLAHEIRNPLATVRGCVEMIERSDCPCTEHAPYLELALRESDRLNNLLRDFLTFAHLDAPHKQKANLTALIRAHLPRKSDGLVIRDELPESLELEYDSDQISLVLSAIVLSLSEWAEGEGEIRVDVPANSKKTIRFLLARHTIPQTVRDAVFQPFSGVQKSSNSLALPTAMRAMHAHGGKLTLDTEPGVGTWFELAI